MNECPTCGLPLVWSTLYERMNCAVYGTHPAVVPNVRRTPSPLILEACRFSMSPGAVRQRRHVNHLRAVS